MAQFSDMVITRAGLDMIAESQAGGTLIFTKAKLGNGQLGEEEITELTDVISEKMEVSLYSVTASSIGHVEIQFTVDNTELDVGFFVREIGIFAKVNETGTEQLYGYTNAGNYTNYLSDKSTPIDAITVKIDLVVGDASEVSFITDKSLVYVTQEEFEQVKSDLTGQMDDLEQTVTDKTTKLEEEVNSKLEELEQTVTDKTTELEEKLEESLAEVTESVSDVGQFGSYQTLSSYSGTATQSGIFVIMSSHNTTITIYINGTEIAHVSKRDQYGTGETTLTCPIAAGQTYTIEGAQKVTFFPLVSLS